MILPTRQPLSGVRSTTGRRLVTRGPPPRPSPPKKHHVINTRRQRNPLSNVQWFEHAHWHRDHPSFPVQGSAWTNKPNEAKDYSRREKRFSSAFIPSRRSGATKTTVSLHLCHWMAGHCLPGHVFGSPYPKKSPQSPVREEAREKETPKFGEWQQ